MRTQPRRTPAPALPARPAALLRPSLTRRSALRAVRDARRKGIPVGFFRPITLWPFPDAELAKMALGARTIIVPELNCGQMVLEVERLFRGRSEVLPLNLVNGELFKPSEIGRKIEEVA